MLPPYNGAATFTGSLALAAADHRQRSGASRLRTGRSLAVHHVRAVWHPAERADADRGAMEFQRPATTQLQYGFSRGLRRIARIPRPVERRSQQHSRANLRQSPAVASRAATTPPRSTGARRARNTFPSAARPNPYLSAGFFWYTEGNSSYNALQMDLTRRMSRGLQFRAAYTWSKNLDMNSGMTGAQSENQAQMVMNRFDLSRDWGPSALMCPAKPALSGVYELPFGRNARGVGKKSSSAGGN